jgi:hypothetical protein
MAAKLVATCDGVSVSIADLCWLTLIEVALRHNERSAAVGTTVCPVTSRSSNSRPVYGSGGRGKASPDAQPKLSVSPGSRATTSE